MAPAGTGRSGMKTPVVNGRGSTWWKNCKGVFICLFFFQAEDGIRDYKVTGVQTCALPILRLFEDDFHELRLEKMGYETVTEHLTPEDKRTNLEIDLAPSGCRAARSRSIPTDRKSVV